MEDARYLRSQAALCMRVAEETANAHLAETFRDVAAKYFADAVRIEADRRRPRDH